MQALLERENYSEKYSLKKLLELYGIDPKFLSSENENHQIKPRYKTNYIDPTAGWTYFFNDTRLHAWTRLNGRWVVNPNDYGIEADDNHIHENAHINYQTGDEGFVRGEASYQIAIGKKPNPRMNSE